MREVITLRNSPFSKQLARLKAVGGSAASASRKAQEIIGDLTLGGDCSRLETNHGESRIKMCVKYDLPSGYRLVTIQPQADLVVTCFLGTHAEADRWLTDNAGLTVIYAPESRRLDIVQHQKTVPTALPPAFNLPTTPKLLCSDLSDEIVEQLLPGKALRRAFSQLNTDSSDDDILSFCDDVLSDVDQDRSTALFDIICALREGAVAQARVRADVALGLYKPVTEEQPIADAALRDPINAEHIIILSDLTPHEWEVLGDRKKFDDWMVWLHPDQKRMAEVDLPGPTALDGVSGSGKTCVLVHRARNLAQKYSREPILVLTLNRSLARLIGRLLKRLCSPEELMQIEVLSFHEYLCGILKYLGLDQFLSAIREPLKIDDEIQHFINDTDITDLTSLFEHRDENQIAALWTRFFGSSDSGSQRAQERLKTFMVEASSQPELDISRYIYEELGIAQSVSRLGEQFEAYRRHDRKGRCLRFGPDQREATLRILQTWLKYQLKNGVLDESWLTQAGLLAMTLIKELPAELRYRAVLVDEYQDFSSLELDLIRRVPTATVNGLFLTGDHAQRIYTKQFDFDRAGLGTIERRRIRKNYRNSRQILEAGQALLESFCGETSAREAGVTVLPPEYAARNSARPFVSKASSPIAAAWKCVTEWVEAENPPCTVCVITTAPLEFPVEAIVAAAPSPMRASKLSGDYIFDADSVVVSTATSVKGFEFGLIIIVGLDDSLFPRKGAVKAELWRDALRLYVAITRARDELQFIYQNSPSPFLIAMAPFTEEREIKGVMGSQAQDQAFEPENPPSLPTPPSTSETSQPSRIPKPWNKDHMPAPLFNEKGARSSDLIQDIDDTSDAGYATELEEDTSAINGYTLMPIPFPCSQLILCRILGISHTELQLACYRHDLFLTPNEEIPKVFIARIMDAYDCIPVFRQHPRPRDSQDAAAT